MYKLTSKLGFLLFMIGAGGMDSHNQLVPAAMVLIGLAIIGITALKENSPAPTDQSMRKTTNRK